MVLQHTGQQLQSHVLEEHTDTTFRLTEAATWTYFNHPEDEDSKFLQNTGEDLLSYMVDDPRRLSFQQYQLWKSENLNRSISVLQYFCSLKHLH
jgi:hypothetical protein